MADEPQAAAGSATDKTVADTTVVTKSLSPAAARALAEAAARRAKIDRGVAALDAERHGRKGPEPVRYGDWEVKGLASDF
jgi:hypothetical protein